MWSQAALEHFQETRFQPLLKEASLEVGWSSERGDFYRLQLVLADNQIQDIRFATSRCLVAVACFNYASRWALHRDPAELDQLQACQMLRALAPLPPPKVYWAALVWGAFQEAAAGWKGEPLC